MPAAGEDRDDEVRQHAQCEQARRERPVAAGAQPAGQHAEVDERERQRDRERELARHRRRDVAAVDGERLVEEEHDRDCGEHRGRREAQPAELAERPRGDGQGEHARDRHELECEPVGQDDVEDDHSQRRDDHVELVGGEAGVPVGRPAREAEVRQQVVAQVRRRPDVGTHVAAGRRAVREQQVGMELRQREDHGADHDPEGDPALDGDGGETPCEPLDPSGPALGGRVDGLPGRARPGAREVPEGFARGGRSYEARHQP